MSYGETHCKRIILYIYLYDATTLSACQSVRSSARLHYGLFYESALNDHENTFRNITKTHEKVNKNAWKKSTKTHRFNNNLILC